jgi:hypothetical protein
MGTPRTRKSGQRDRSDHRLRGAKPGNTVHFDCNSNPNLSLTPENLPAQGKAKATAKPANADEVTTGFGVELSASEQQPSQLVPSTSLCEPFRDAIKLGLSQGRHAMAIGQDLVSESRFRGGYQTVKRFVRKLRGHHPASARRDHYRTRRRLW